MDLHQLFIFIKVVEHNSFSKAAEEVFLSQSTISSHIKALETSLKLQLFDRDYRQPILTPHGERLYKWAKQILLLKDQAMLDLMKDEAEYSGKIRISASSVPGTFIVPKLVQQFTKIYPNISFHITESSSKTVAETLLKRAVDAGFIGKKFEDDKLCYIPILKEKLVLITPNDLDLENKVSIEDIVHYPFISRHSDSGTQATVNHALIERGIPLEQLHTVVYTDTTNSLIQYVKNGCGIALVSETTAVEYANLGLIKMYNLSDFQEERQFYLVYHNNRTLSLAAKLFIEKVKEWAEESAGYGGRFLNANDSEKP